MSEFRLQRVENLIRDQISELIMQEVIKDPRVDTLLSVSRVKVSKDLSYANVFISSIRSEKRTERAVAALNHASGFIQHKLRGKFHLKNTPVLRFKKDNTIADGFEITQKIKDLP